MLASIIGIGIPRQQACMHTPIRVNTSKFTDPSLPSPSSTRLHILEGGVHLAPPFLPPSLPPSLTVLSTSPWFVKTKSSARCPEKVEGLGPTLSWPGSLTG